MAQYIPYLEQAGFSCEAISLLDTKYLEGRLETGKRGYIYSLGLYFKHLWALRRVFQADLVILCIEIFPYFPAVFERLLKFFRIPYIYDYDDPIFHYYDLHSSAWVRFLLGTKIKTVIRLSDYAFCGSHYLLDYAVNARDGKQGLQELLPTVIDLKIYSRTKQVQADRSSSFVIVWIGSPSTSVYLDEIADALREVSKQIPLKLVLVGSGPKIIEGVTVEVHPWSEATEIDLLLSGDVGVMPLIDDQWSRGKCGFKLIQYMACGLPVVTSPVGENGYIVENGVSGFWAKSKDEWVQSLLKLYESSELRAKMGSAGRRVIESRYCLQVTAPRFVERAVKMIQEHAK